MNRVRVIAALMAWLAARRHRLPRPRTTVPASAVTLLPADASRWDASAHVTWLGQHLPGSFGWDRWYQVAVGSASVGYYFTPHLKAEFDIGTSTRGESYSIEPVPAPPGPIPPGTVFQFLQRNHEFRVTAASAGLSAQFFENMWFHPFLSGGVEFVRERERIDVTLPFRDTERPASAPDSTTFHGNERAIRRPPVRRGRIQGLRVRARVHPVRPPRLMVVRWCRGAGMAQRCRSGLLKRMTRMRTTARLVTTILLVVLTTAHTVTAQVPPQIWRSFAERVGVGTELQRSTQRWPAVPGNAHRRRKRRGAAATEDTRAGTDAGDRLRRDRSPRADERWHRRGESSCHRRRYWRGCVLRNLRRHDCPPR